MEAILEQINSVGKTFIEFAVPMLIQSSVLIIILLCLDLILRKRIRAVFRYWIWMIVLVKLMLPPTLSLPTSPVYWFGDKIQGFVKQEASVPQESIAYSPVIPERTIIPAGNTIESTSNIEKEAVVPPVVTEMSLTWQAMVFLIWLVSLLIMIALLIQRAVFVKRLVAQSQKANDEMNSILECACRQMGIRNKISLKLSDTILSPSVCGLIRPTILIPKVLAEKIDSNNVRSILLHELAHIKRYDLWINLLQTVLQIVYIYNPLLWVANYIIRNVREQAVDEMVLVAMGQHAEEYPKTLLNISRFSFGSAALSLRLIGVAESKKALVARIRHITSRPFPTSVRIGAFRTIAIIIAACIFLPMAGASQTNKLQELLDKHKETREKLTNSFIVKFELTRNNIRFATDSEPPIQTDNTETYRKHELRYDGKQYNQRNFSWGELGTIWPNQTRTITDVPENEARYQSFYDANCGSITYMRTRPGNPGLLHFSHEPRNAAKAQMVSAMGAWRYGYWDHTSIDELLSNPESKASVRERTEEIGGSQCYVIDADTNRGKFTIWLDPAHGYNIAREEVIVEEGDIRGSSTHQEGDRLTEIISNVKFRQIDGVWVPWESVVEGISDSKTYSYHITDKQTYKTTEFIIDPDHEALGSFEPDDIPNGASALIVGVGADEISCKWQDGKVVDSNGREVNQEYLESHSFILKVPISLAGKPLPSLTEFNINPELTVNRKLLICFWDMNQRPSRNCILELNKKAQELKEQDVVVVAVQTENIDEETFNNWCEEQNISFPTSVIKTDQEQTKLSWGVKALPWLILTDKQHNVTTEGFSVNELDEKISAL